MLGITAFHVVMFIALIHLAVVGMLLLELDSNCVRRLTLKQMLFSSAAILGLSIVALSLLALAFTVLNS